MTEKIASLHRFVNRYLQDEFASHLKLCSMTLKYLNMTQHENNTGITSHRYTHLVNGFLSPTVELAVSCVCSAKAAECTQPPYHMPRPPQWQPMHGAA